MRRLFCILTILVVWGAPSFADEKPLPWWGSYNSPGTFILDGSVTTLNMNFDRTDNTDNSSFIQINGEYVLSKFYIQDSMPLDLGLMVTGVSGFELEERSSFAGTGGGICAHIGFRGFGGKFGSILEKLDIYSSIGVGYTFVLNDNANVKDWSGINDTPVTVFGRLGAAYYLSDSFAITADNTHWGVDSSISLGARLRFGNITPVGERPVHVKTKDPVPVSITESAGTEPEEEKTYIKEPLSTGEAEFYLELFRQLYWSVFSHGGLQIDDYNYIEGEGTVFTIKIYDDETGSYRNIEIRKALIKRNPDHSSWAYVLDLGHGDTLGFEINLDTQDLLLELTVIDDDTISTFVPDYPMDWNAGIILEQRDFSGYEISKGRIDAPSGSFNCSELFYDAGEYTYTWWVSDDVPGYIVRFNVKKNGREYIKGELQEINLRNTSFLGD